MIMKYWVFKEHFNREPEVHEAVWFDGFLYMIANYYGDDVLLIEL